MLWLSPIYKSPNRDMGYDISSYRELDPRYGDLADMDTLLQGLRSPGIKLMDLVVNHTSNLVCLGLRYPHCVRCVCVCVF